MGLTLVPQGESPHFLKSLIAFLCVALQIGRCSQRTKRYDVHIFRFWILRWRASHYACHVYVD
jgi:hypothetical protein